MLLHLICNLGSGASASLPGSSGSCGSGRLCIPAPARFSSLSRRSARSRSSLCWLWMLRSRSSVVTTEIRSNSSVEVLALVDLDKHAAIQYCSNPSYCTLFSFPNLQTFCVKQKSQFKTISQSRMNGPRGTYKQRSRTI